MIGNVSGDDISVGWGGGFYINAGDRVAENIDGGVGCILINGDVFRAGGAEKVGGVS